METRKGRKPYPIKHTNQIIRVKTSDAKEWLKSRKEWIGIDNQGNELTETHYDDKLWDNRQVFQYGMKPADPNKQEVPKEHKVIGLNGWVRQYELPFIV